MSSTKSSRRIKRFFTQELTSRAKRLRERGVYFFPLGPDAEESWYLGPPDCKDFVQVDTRELRKVLCGYWASQGLPELVELVEPLLELKQSKALLEQESGDVSPFVYVMY